eukprot:554466-Rhodomonas_salina.1
MASVPDLAVGRYAILATSLLCVRLLSVTVSDLVPATGDRGTHWQCSVWGLQCTVLGCALCV